MMLRVRRRVEATPRRWGSGVPAPRPLLLLLVRGRVGRRAAASKCRRHARRKLRGSRVEAKGAGRGRGTEGTACELSPAAAAAAAKLLLLHVRRSLLVPKLLLVVGRLPIAIPLLRVAPAIMRLLLLLLHVHRRRRPITPTAWLPPIGGLNAGARVLLLQAVLQHAMGALCQHAGGRRAEAAAATVAASSAAPAGRLVPERLVGLDVGVSDHRLLQQRRTREGGVAWVRA